MNLHRMPWLIILAILYVGFLTAFVGVAYQGDWTAMLVMGTMLIIVGNLIGALIIYRILFSILERLQLMHQHSIERGRYEF